MGSSRYPTPSSAAVTAVMKSNRKTDSRPEVALRANLHRKGLRFRKNHLLRLPGISVRPDIVFTRAKVAVFLDGCFWHGCPEHGNKPRTNSGYWGPKLARNKERDLRVTQALEDNGWRVVRIWEHVSPELAVSVIVAALEGSS